MAKSKPITRRKKTDSPVKKPSSLVAPEEMKDIPVEEGGKDVFQIIRKDLSDGIEYQIKTFKSNLQTELEHELRLLSSQNRRYFWMLVSVFVVLVGMTIATVFGMLRSFSTSQKQTLDERMSEMKMFTGSEVERYAFRMDSALAVLQRTVEIKLTQRNNELMTYFKGLNEIYSLDSAARRGSRTAFTQLQNISKRGGEKEEAVPLSAPSSIEKNLFNTKLQYAVLRSPEYSTGGEYAPIILGSDTTIVTEVSGPQLVKLMQDPRLSVHQVHAVMSQLWKQQPEQITVDLLYLLENSNNLAANVAACSLLSHYYGPKADIYEFDKWIQFLKVKLQVKG